MEITKEIKNGIVCLKVAGRLDTITAPNAEKTLLDTVSTDGAKMIINLSELQYISSAGLRVLLVVAKEVKSKSGKVVLVAMTQSVRKVFDISGFTSIFDIQETTEAGIKRF